MAHQNPDASSAAACETRQTATARRRKASARAGRAGLAVLVLAAGAPPLSHAAGVSPTNDTPTDTATPAPQPRKVRLAQADTTAAKPAATTAPAATSAGAAASVQGAPVTPGADGSPVELPAVNVNAALTSPQHLEQAVDSGVLGARSQLDTPFSTTTVTQQDLADRQVSKLGDVFFGDASVSDNSDANNVWASYLSVRGLQLDWANSYKIDGMPFNGYGITLPYEQFERVELLKGLSGFMYGFGSPGGIVNYVTKRATSTPVQSIDIGYRSPGVVSEHIDIGRKFGQDDRFGLRLNYTHEDGRLYNGGYLKRNSLSAAFDAQLTSKFSVSADIMYQQRNMTGQMPSIYTGLFTGNALPAAINSANSNLTSGGTYLKTSMQIYTVGAKYDFSPNWTLSTKYSINISNRDRNEDSLYLNDSAGNYSDYRYIGLVDQQYQYWQSMLEGKVYTGPFLHHLVAGLSWQRQSTYNEQTSFFNSIGSGNIYAQNPYNYYAIPNLGKYHATDIQQNSFFMSDTVDLTRQWSVLAGFRYTDYTQKGYATTGAFSTAYKQDGVITPTFAVMFKPTTNTTLYASYVQALEQGATVGATYANYGETLNPLMSKQYEVGLKTAHERWSATAALFRIERGAAYANSENVYVEDGQSIYQGAEVAGAAKLTREWNVSASAMFLDSWYAKGTDYNGNRVAGTPNMVLTGHIGYEPAAIPGLRFGVDTKFTGRTALRAAGGVSVPSYVTVNLGAAYHTTIARHGVTFRAGIDNLFNEKYWEYQYADYVRPGDPLTGMVNVKVDF